MEPTRLPRDPAAPGRRFARIGQRLAAKPGGALLALAAVVFAANVVSASAVQKWLPGLGSIEPVVDAAVDLVLVMPLLLVLFVLPTRRHLHARIASEHALRAAGDALERRVQERTVELERSNTRLRQEADHRRHAQKAVAFQASLLDAVAEAVVALDAGGHVLFWNRFAERLFGWSASEATGKGLTDLVGFVSPDGQRVDVLELCGASGGWASEVDAIGRDGARAALLLTCTDLPGATRGFVCVALDIAEWKVARDALRDSEEKYSSLVDNSPTGVFIYQDGRLVFANPRFAEILEHSREDILEADPWSLVHPHDREWVMEIARKRADGDKVPEAYECRLLTSTGRCRWVAMRSARIRYSGSMATLGNAQDITEHKEMEIKLRQLSARLLTIQEEERRRLALDLHDSLGQTLTGIKFMVEAALGDPWPEERRSAVLRLRSVVPRIQDAVEDVRRIATELRPSILDDLGLLPTINWYLRELEANHPGIAVEKRLTAAESDVPRDLRTPIFRILQEATNNVVKHSAASRLLVALETGEGRLRLSVQDDGVGFDTASAPGADGNRGVGLGSMRERAELAGGTCSLTSAPGCGATVQAEWPLDRPISG